MVSKVLALLAQSQGFEVKQSEVHGMAKRGGSVFSHVRFGRRVWSPTIPKGDVDILVALEWAEGLRWLPFLKPGTGIFICDTKRIVPPFACLNRHPGAPHALFEGNAGRSHRACRRRLRHRRHRHGGSSSATSGRPTSSCSARMSTALNFRRRGLGKDGRRIRAEEDHYASISKPSAAAAIGSRKRATRRRRSRPRWRKRRRRPARLTAYTSKSIRPGARAATSA